MALRVKKGDTVQVIAGRDKGARGQVLKVLANDRVLVEGVNRVKRHQRPTPREQQGGIIEREAPIHRSNLMLVDGKTDKPTRTRVGENNDGRKVRIAVKSGTVLDS
ncbi:MAG: 50S ribosomal protein L24 [Proteobacteria bacterium]|nr:50S ribosomal protein L24 [Pseudomonadota bacterium]